VHNNLWDTNFPSQQAFEMSFHYRIGAIATTDPDAASAFASRTGAAASHPLLAVLAPATRIAATVDAAASVLRLSDERIRVLGVTVPTPGHILVRLQSVAAHDVECTIELDVAIRSAWAATALGEARTPLPLAQNTLAVPIPTFGTAAVLLELTEL
jgi:hypothetical protein